MNKTTLLFWMGIAGLLVGLVYLARLGDVWAASILVAAWTLLTVTFGAVIVIYVNRQQGQKQQADFTANMRENLALMQAMQRVQNEQNKTVMHQLGQTAKLPTTKAPAADVLVIEDGIFDELDA